MSLLRPRVPSLSVATLLALGGALFPAGVAAQADPTAQAAASALALDGSPIVGTVHLHPGYTPDPVTVGATSGGVIEHPTCGGFVAAQPAITIDVTANLHWLRVYAASDADVGLRILSPEGQWRCADDTYSTHPAVDGRFTRGMWRVWVSSATPAAAGAQAQVTFTTHRGQIPGEANARATSGHAASGGDGTVTSLINTVSSVLGRRGASPGAVADPEPRAVGPLASLAQAGIDPSQVSRSLMDLLHRQNTGANALDPRQLLQLDLLGRQGLDATQLQSVVSAMLHPNAAPPDAPPAILNADGLNRVVEMARAGATAVQLQSEAAQLLGPVLQQVVPTGGP